MGLQRQKDLKAFNDAFGDGSYKSLRNMQKDKHQKSVKQVNSGNRFDSLYNSDSDSDEADKQTKTISKKQSSMQDIVIAMPTLIFNPKAPKTSDFEIASTSSFLQSIPATTANLPCKNSSTTKAILATSFEIDDDDI